MKKAWVHIRPFGAQSTRFGMDIKIGEFLMNCFCILRENKNKDRSKKGRAARISMDRAIKTTPPSLLGIDRKIA